MIDCYWEDRYRDMCEMFPEATDFFRDNVHPYTYHGVKQKQIILVDATPGKANAIRWYQNQGGNVDADAAALAGYVIPTVSEPLKKTCMRPFRELVIHHDGTVPICCNDWQEEAVAGHFPETSLKDLWYGNLDRFRIPLWNRDRTGQPPCENCSERSGFKVGFEKWFEGESVK